MIKKPNNLNVFGSNKTNGPTQNWLRSPMSEVGEPISFYKITLLRNCKFQ
jgi:hypothetical protein